MGSKSFKVIIVGGSVAGLTLAHCLERARINYVVLERNIDIAPQLGSAIVLMPNGSRILDQLGILEEIEHRIEPLNEYHFFHSDGSGFISDFLIVLKKRFGYSIGGLDRQTLLEALYRTLPDKSKVHTECQVVKVQKFPFGLRVFTANGHFYDGDLVVGADGVHGRIRSEMWRIADVERPGLITSAEKNGLYADYAGVFGISAAVPCLDGHNVLSMHNGLGIYAFHLENKRIGWLVMQKLDKRYYFPNIPRFTQHDASNLCESLRKKLLGGAKFDDIWVRKESFSMVALEENLFQTWHFDRIVCLGDSMHKVTPVSAQGASCAIESAAALANSLHDLTSVNHIQKPSDFQLNSFLYVFSDSRMARLKKIVRLDAFVAPLFISHRTMSKIVIRYLLPHIQGLVADLISGIVVGGVLLNYEPSPKRARGQEWQPGWHRLLLIFVIDAFSGIPIL